MVSWSERRGITLALSVLAASPSLARAAGPIGEVTVDCTQVQGWAQDPDVPATPIAVHLYFDGPAGDPAAVGVPLTADLALPGCVGEPCGHGFRGALPLSRLDGQPHPVHAYGIDTADPNLELSLSPAIYTCAPPPIVSGVKRHIAGPSILVDWQFSTYFDLVKVADLDLAAVPKGVAVAGPPQLAVGEGDTALWLIDQGFRRPVAPELAAAWRFAPASATVMPAAELAALPEGTPLSARPVLVQGSGPEVYLLDEHQCAADDPHPDCEQPIEPTTGGDETGVGDDDSGDESGEPATVTGEGESSGGGDSSGPGDPESTGGSEDTGAAPQTGEGEGCGCRGGAEQGAWALAWVVLLGRRRARR